MFHAPCSMLEFSNYHPRTVKIDSLARIPSANLYTKHQSMTKHIHALLKFMISVVLSLIAWTVVDHFIVHVSFMQYFFIEVVIIISQFAYDWQLKQLNHEKEVVK